ncbi:MAG: zinc ribbon domain-containing protein [Firmicutes bacterium]|nr:zinc ribbon domain-containing protein [Bacillota bacterium]
MGLGAGLGFGLGWGIGGQVGGRATERVLDKIMPCPISQRIKCKCGTINEKGSSFCMSCANDLRDMQCPCGQVNKHNAKFCTACAADFSKMQEVPLVLVCKCGFEVKQGDKFCSGCSTKIECPKSELACKKCMNVNQKDFRFCAFCGEARPK